MGENSEDILNMECDEFWSSDEEWILSNPTVFEVGPLVDVKSEQPPEGIDSDDDQFLLEASKCFDSPTGNI